MLSMERSRALSLTSYVTLSLVKLSKHASISGTPHGSSGNCVKMNAPDVHTNPRVCPCAYPEWNNCVAAFFPQVDGEMHVLMGVAVCAAQHVRVQTNNSCTHSMRSTNPSIIF